VGVNRTGIGVDLPETVGVSVSPSFDGAMETEGAGIGDVVGWKEVTGGTIVAPQTVLLKRVQSPRQLFEESRH
jgi:hypothetical protein